MAQSLSTRERRVLVEAGHDGRVTSSGHLTYVSGGALLAMPFDGATVSTTGSAVSLLRGLGTAIAGLSGAAFYDVSDHGTLVYVGGLETLRNYDLSTLAWFDREGNVVPLPIEAELFHTHLDLSPDGRFLAAAVLDDEVPHIRIQAVDRPGGQRLTSESSWDPVWSPDGEWVYYSAVRGGDHDIWRRRADLSAPEQPVLESPGCSFPERSRPTASGSTWWPHAPRYASWCTGSRSVHDAEWIQRTCRRLRNLARRNPLHRDRLIGMTCPARRSPTPLA